MSRDARYGKKIGTLEVKLDRKKDRYTNASVETELRFDLSKGTFAAQWEGNWYTADTKKDLSDQIKKVATKTLDLKWQRYLLIDYEAEGWPIADPKTGRPEINGRYHSFDLDEPRSKFGRGYDEDEAFAICSIKLRWSLCEISDPYPLPEDPRKLIRARRDVDVYGPKLDQEQIGQPAEWDDAVLPPGTLLWTPEREALLHEVLAALGKLDQRLVDLFSGDAAQLAAKIDAATQTDPSRLLAAPPTDTAPKGKKRKTA